MVHPSDPWTERSDFDYVLGLVLAVGLLLLLLLRFGLL
jgi:hypothetical protein